MSRNDVLIGELHLEGRVRQSLNNDTFKFDCVLWQKNPSVSLWNFVKISVAVSERVIHQRQDQHTLARYCDGILVMG